MMDEAILVRIVLWIKPVPASMLLISTALAFSHAIFGASVTTLR